MKISPEILNIPPYISTAWKNVSTLYLKENTLIIELKGGSIVEVPNLSKEILNQIFAAHAENIDTPQEKEPSTSEKKSPNPLALEMPFQFGIGNMDSLTSAMQHNPEQANAPKIPSDILSKITNVAKALGLDYLEEMSKPEPHCNCMYCQIARALNGEDSLLEETEEEISPEDLKFEDWQIEQTDDKLYQVKNPLDQEEIYNVFLGEPLGCTCGKKNCEHIRAVLES